jgi:uncharacterized protein
MSTELETPLNENDLAELDEFLLSDACDEDALSIDEAHGFLTALAVTPQPATEDNWMNGIWGQPEFADEQQRQRMTSLLRRLYQEIVTTLEARRDFEPLVIETEEGGEVLEAYEGWCFGFMLGVEEQQELWDELPQNEHNLVAPMAQLALLYSDEETDMDDDEYDDWVELIPGAVMGLYAYWH